MAESLGEALRAILTPRLGNNAPPPQALPPEQYGLDPLSIPFAGGDLSIQGGIQGGMRNVPPEWTAMFNYRKPF